MVDVFISYSRRDEAAVAVLAHAIEAEGYDVWWDAELPPHQSYGDVITAKIAQAKAAVVVWSADAVQSEWVRAEADMARNQRKLIQTSLANIMPPLPFNQIQFADLSGWRGEAEHTGWRKVKASLAELCGKGETGVARSASAPRQQAQPAHLNAASPAASKWPLQAGGGIAAVALIGAGAYALGQRNGSGTPPAEVSAVAVGAQEHGATVSAAAVGGGDDGASRFDLLATVVDPDGYSNLRVSPSGNGRIIGRVLEGKAFATFRQSGEWWHVRLADGTTGYVARSRIRLADEADVSGAAAAAAVESGESGPVPAAASWDMTFPDSSTRLLSEADVAGLGPATLRQARNEIYARKGRRFRDPDLREHFSQFSWYRPIADDVPLNPTERRNVELIQRAEARFQ